MPAERVAMRRVREILRHRLEEGLGHQSIAVRVGAGPSTVRDTHGESEQLSHAEWLGLLLDREWSSRHDRKLATRLRFANLRHHAVPRDVDYRSERGLDRALFMKLIAG